MKKKKVCFIAQFPPPLHGLSKAVDTLYHSDLMNEFDLEKIDITNNKRILQSIVALIRSKADLFYFTISQTKPGNIRDLILLKLLRIFKKKCIVHLHGGYYRQLVDNDMGSLQKKLNFNEIGNVQGAIVLSESLKCIFKGMMHENKIHVVPNCVEDEYLMPDEKFDEKIQQVTHKKVLHMLYLSNFIRSKGYAEVLELAHLEKTRCHNGGEQRLHFNFAGKFFEDSEKEHFFETINKHGLEEFITYHGVVSGEEKINLLSSNDIFILLTRYPNEGQPISILEAMGNGMMVITTDHAGIPDIVENQLNGIVCSKEMTTQDIYDLVNKQDKPSLQKMMLTNREKVKSGFREKQYVEKIKYLFNMQ
ncbi:glycosyltransferase family 4 protein [Paenibacillus sp. BK720]|uniref:glycosyltransferase family 4 protein n=1 Tax=Paenibacillus sp. BK720 TaxID=2587092 RepID=UPI00141DD97F|nr:glycosyltransferase family 4 protein [Paenibacillus sp. BK720]NIK69235.1 glycosyltransferase involved in cell wall biosynthesis [Paenibacillus sp. BK720]